MHSESGDDDEPVKYGMTVTGTHHRQIGEVHSRDVVRHGAKSDY